VTVSVLSQAAPSYQSSHSKVEASLLSALPKDTTSKPAVLPLHSLKC